MNKKKVLLAEDDVDDRNIFVDFLSDREDIIVMCCVDNGIKVFELLDAIADERDYPDLILLDHNMPKMSGRETLEALKHHTQYRIIPVFIYSTYADTSLVINCTCAGAEMVASKPVTKAGYEHMMDEFMACIRQK